MFLYGIFDWLAKRGDCKSRAGLVCKDQSICKSNRKHSRQRQHRMTQNMTLRNELTFFHYYLGVFLPGEKGPFRGKCSGVLCALKASAKISTERSSDGPGKANDILNHQQGTTSGTREKEGSWWSVDLGLNHRLVITHLDLRHGKSDADSLLTEWQLQGSIDRAKGSWEKIETIYSRDDPPFSDCSAYVTGRWSVGGKRKAFRYFRIFQTRVNSSGKYGIYLSGIELYGALFKN